MRVTIVEGYRQSLATEMRKDDAVYVIGEDVRGGGAFETTVGLVDEFGPGRVVDAPISEAAIMGVAIGSAIKGLRPVVDFQYGDFIYAASDQIHQHATTLGVMSGGRVSVPLVLQLPTGASGRGAQHAHSVESELFGTPGMVIATPATPADAAGLLRTALDHDGVVAICIHKHLYGAADRPLLHPETSTGELPEAIAPVPFGSARVARAGDDITIVADLLMLHRSLAAAEELAAAGFSAEVVDPRTIAPLDVEVIADSVGRTGSVLVVEEGPRMGGWGGYLMGELAERIGLDEHRCRRLAGADAAMPYAPALEAAMIPSQAEIVRAVHELLR